MIIESAYWTAKVNVLLIRCQCGNLFEHPANRRTAVCSRCGSREDTLLLKNKLPETRVVNIKTSPYVADVIIDRTTIFGNPFKEWQWGRERCIKKFETYFYQRIERDLIWRDQVLQLRGKVLGCHCKPLACHGDVYVEYLEAYDQLEQIRKG